MKTLSYHFACVALTTSLIAASSQALAANFDGAKLDLEFKPPRKLHEVPSAAFEPSATRTLKSSTDETFKLVVLENQSESAAKERIESRRTELRHAFEPSIDPYYGGNADESRKRLSESKLEDPAHDDAHHIRVQWNMYGNERFALSAQTKQGLNAVRYRADVVLLYCKKSKRFFEIKRFTRANRKDALGFEADCLPASTR